MFKDRQARSALANLAAQQARLEVEAIEQASDLARQLGRLSADVLLVTLLAGAALGLALSNRRLLGMLVGSAN